MTRRRGGGGGGVRLGYRFPEWAGPPPGTYDPGFEAQARQTQRGLLDLIEQTHREGSRGRVDVRTRRRELGRKLSQGREDIGRQRGYAESDTAYRQNQLQTSFARDLQDLATAKQHGEEAYQRTLVDLQHRYSTVAANQQAAATRLGAGEGGTAAASTAVRGANQAHDAGEVNRQHTEALEELQRREDRLRQDYATGTEHLQEGLQRQLTGYGVAGQRLGQDVHLANRALSLAASRAALDRATRLSHAKREQGIYQTDVTQQAYYQAHQLNPSLVYPVPSAAGGHVPHAYGGRIPRPRGSGGVSYPGQRRPRGAY